MHPTRALGAALLLLTCVTACGSPIGGTATVGSESGGSTAATADATKVVNIVPVDSSGAAVSGFEVQAGGGQVEYCMASPVGAGPDIVSCSPSAAGADVCWVAADRHNLSCGIDPWQKKLFSAHSAEAVPQTPKTDNPMPWGLGLANGARCRVRNGGAGGGREDGLVPAYYCEAPFEELPVLVEQDNPGGLINRSDPLWTVRVGQVGPGNTPEPAAQVVRVRTAYFAGSP